MKVSKHTSRLKNFFTLFELAKKIKIYTRQPGNLFLISINVYEDLNSNKKFQI